MLQTELYTHEAVQHSLPKIADAVSELADAVSKIGVATSGWVPHEDPKFCMDFDEWASRLDSVDRRKLMNFLWNSRVWHSTCLREEESPWIDEPDTTQEPERDESDEDPDLPF